MWSMSFKRVKGFYMQIAAKVWNIKQNNAKIYTNLYKLKACVDSLHSPSKDSVEKAISQTHSPYYSNIGVINDLS